MQRAREKLQIGKSQTVLFRFTKLIIDPVLYHQTMTGMMAAHISGSCCVGHAENSWRIVPKKNRSESKKGFNIYPSMWYVVWQFDRVLWHSQTGFRLICQKLYTTGCHADRWGMKRRRGYVAACAREQDSIYLDRLPGYVVSACMGAWWTNGGPTGCTQSKSMKTIQFACMCILCGDSYRGMLCMQHFGFGFKGGIPLLVLLPDGSF